MILTSHFLYLDNAAFDQVKLLVIKLIHVISKIENVFIMRNDENNGIFHVVFECFYDH